MFNAILEKYEDTKDEVCLVLINEITDYLEDEYVVEYFLNRPIDAWWKEYVQEVTLEVVACCNDIEKARDVFSKYVREIGDELIKEAFNDAVYRKYGV